MDGVESVAPQLAKTTEARQAEQQVLAVRMGRGRTGGSTLADWIIQCARHKGRRVAIGDGDRRNPTLAGFYPSDKDGGATQPDTDETADVKDWITKALGNMVATQSSLVLDLGGGDRVLAEYGRDLGLVEFCEAAGVVALPLYVSGPDMDDFEHVLTIWRAGYFNTPHSVLVFNEHLIPQGRTPIGAFDAITARPEFQEMVEDGMEPIFMPRLPCMKEMRAAGLSFLDAMANKPGLNGKVLDPVRQFMVATWHKKMVKAFKDAGALEWLP